jgi:hypothetical protein
MALVKLIDLGWKSGLMDNKPDSQLEGRGFESHPMIYENGVKIMLWLIPANNPGSLNQ